MALTESVVSDDSGSTVVEQEVQHRAVFKVWCGCQQRRKVLILSMERVEEDGLAEGV